MVTLSLLVIYMLREFIWLFEIHYFTFFLRNSPIFKSSYIYHQCLPTCYGCSEGDERGSMISQKNRA